MAELTAPIQLVVDTEKLLEQIGWTTRGYDYEGDAYEDTEPVDLKRDLAFQVARILAPELKKEMVAVIREVAKEVARERVAEIIDETLAAGFRKTNSYGEPTGEAVTLREMVVDEVKGQLERRVNRNGHRAESYDRDAQTYVHYLASMAAKDALRGELATATTAAVDEVKDQVKAIVAEHLGAKIAQTVTR